MNREQVFATARLAGTVLRYHTWPVHDHQTVGEHTWQVLRIYISIWGAPDPATTLYMVWHDAGELVTGDLPFPIKKNNQDLKMLCDALENEALRGMGVELPTLMPAIRDRIKLCDLIDMFEFGSVEMARGNTFAQPIINDTWVAIQEMLARPSFASSKEAVGAYLQKFASVFGSVE